MPRRRMLSFAAIALVVLTAPTLGLAGSPSRGPAPSATSFRAQNAQLATKTRSAVLQLYSLDQHLGAAQATLAQLQRQTAALRAERASLALQLGVALRGSRIAQVRLAARLRLLYEQGSVEPLDIVFGAKTLDEALTNIDNWSSVAGQSDDVLRELKAARSALTSAYRRLTAREAVLAAKTHEAQATATTLERTERARSAYISSLATQRQLNDSEISRLVAQARAAQQRSAELARMASAGASTISRAGADLRPTGASGTVTVSATGYSLSGTTATGLHVGYGVVAVDPSVIPLGTHMTIPGYGEAVAADTGGSVSGAMIDLWFPSEALANAWGRRTVTIVLH
jgi:3D (Asp-Asp-Asp) domain-containing protein